MKEELAEECDYKKEARAIDTFRRRLSDVRDSLRYKVPWVWEGSTDRVLVMERVDGVSVGGNVIDGMSQEDRNDVS